MYNFKWNKYQNDHPEYREHIQRRIAKIGDSGRAILDTGDIDAAYANREAQEEMMFNEMGQRKKEQDYNLAESNRRFSTNLSQMYNDLDAERKDMRQSNIFDVGNLLLSGIGGWQEYKAGRGLLEKYNDYIRSL